MNAGQSLGVISAFGISVIGFAIVFGVLVVLMFVIRVLRNLSEMADARAATAAAAATSVAVAKAVSEPVGPSMPRDPNMVPAIGSLGEVKLHNVDDKTAAMLMAIVADEMQAPLNELRFISIREKK